MSRLLSLILLTVFLPKTGAADSALEARLIPIVNEVEKVAASRAIVQAVIAQNSHRPIEFQAMDEDQWKGLPKNHPYVFSFITNAVGDALRQMKGALVSEAFVNDAEGFKVGFLEKTTYWNHRGKPKHDEPMLGKTWIGPVALDASSGAKEVQIAVPILNEGKPIGSLVVGINIFQLSVEK